VAAEHLLEESGRQFVMLLVGIGGVDRDRAGAEPGDQVGQPPLPLFRAAPGFPGQPLADHPADRQADQPVG